MIDFRRQHAFVTGGGSGIGAAIAGALAESGSSVTIAGRTEERLETKAQELSVAYQTADVTDRESVARAIAAAADNQGPISILVNNAGAAVAMPFLRADDDHWDSTLAVNLTGVYNCTRHVVAAMRDAGFGRIVNVASTAALSGYAYVSAYCAAKHGVLGLTRSLALEFASKGITVNAVCPGYTDTEIVHTAIDNIVAKTGRSAEEALQELVKVNPQGRLIQPEEVAATVVWLCGQPSITGQAISVSGGEVM